MLWMEWRQYKDQKDSDGDIQDLKDFFPPFILFLPMQFNMQCYEAAAGVNTSSSALSILLASFLYILSAPFILRPQPTVCAAALRWHTSGGADFYHHHYLNTFHYHKICVY